MPKRRTISTQAAFFPKIVAQNGARCCWWGLTVVLCCVRDTSAFPSDVTDLCLKIYVFDSTVSYHLALLNQVKLRCHHYPPSPLFSWSLQAEYPVLLRYGYSFLIFSYQVNFAYPSSVSALIFSTGRRPFRPFSLHTIFAYANMKHGSGNSPGNSLFQRRNKEAMPPVTVHFDGDLQCIRFFLLYPGVEAPYSFTKPPTCAENPHS